MHILSQSLCFSLKLYSKVQGGRMLTFLFVVDDIYMNIGCSLHVGLLSQFSRDRITHTYYTLCKGISRQKRLKRGGRRTSQHTEHNIHVRIPNTALLGGILQLHTTPPHAHGARGTFKVTAARAPYSPRTRQQSPLRSAVRKTWTRASCPARGPGRPRSPFGRPRPLATAPSPGHPRRGRGG